ncbi:hypothetical protein AAY473_014516 [Plecturocebus cupreus]
MQPTRQVQEEPVSRVLTRPCPIRDSIFSVAQVGVQWRDLSLKVLAQAILPPQSPAYLGLQVLTTYIQLIFKFFVETRSRCVAQAGLKLLASNDLPASASQVVRTSGAPYHPLLIQTTGSHSVAQLECSGEIIAHSSLDLRVQAILLLQPPELECSGIIIAHRSLNFLDSSDHPASASCDLAVSPRLVSNSRFQAILLPQPPKTPGLQECAISPGHHLKGKKKVLCLEFMRRIGSP